MRLLTFPVDSYTLDPKTSSYSYNKKEDSVIGVLELLHSSIEGSPLQMNKKDHKINKRLKSKLRNLTIYKDKDHDARIGIQDITATKIELLLEEDEFDLCKRHIDSHTYMSRFSDDVDRLYDVLDNSQDFKPRLLSE